MAPPTRNQDVPAPSDTAKPASAKTGYLPRLYTESRQILFRILLGEALPSHVPFPTDPDQTAAILGRIKNEFATDSHLNDCRAKIGDKFPGRLAVMFNLAGEDDKLFPNDNLRKSILDHVSRHEENLRAGSINSYDLQKMEELKRSSRLQQQLAYLANYTPNKWLLEQEIPVILQSRSRRLYSNDTLPSNKNPLPAGASGSPQEAAPSPMNDSFAWSRDVGRLSGLCISGGGIRSATFNLGVLQGLATRNLLRRFDYLSSVSGGGYIHQWFAAWVKRQEALAPGAPGSPGLDAVCRQMIPLPEPGCAPVHPEQIRWLRRYSNYLTPKPGILSADTWVTFAIWMRNTFLNQIILISFLLSLLLLPQLFLLPGPLQNLSKIGAHQASGPAPALPFGAMAGAALLGFVLLSYLLLVFNLASGLRNANKGSSCDARLDNESLFWLVVIPALVISISASDFGFYFQIPGLAEMGQVKALCVFFFLSLLLLSLSVTWVAGAMDKRPGNQVDRRIWRVVGFTLAAILASLAGAGAVVLTRNAFVTGSPFAFEPSPATVSAPPAQASANVQLSTGDSQQINLTLQVVRTPAAASAPPAAHREGELKWRLVVVFGTFAVIAIPFLTIILQCGLVGYRFPDSSLEWLARVRALVTMYSVVWMIVVGIALFGHQLVDTLFRYSSTWIKWPAVGGWLLTTAGSVLAGKSSSSGGEGKSNGSSGPINILTIAGPPVYIAGLLFLLAWAAQEALWLAEASSNPLTAFSAVLAVPVVVFLLFGWRVDINEFSMHSYYRNRLARCYLGASNTTRDPDPLTGFDNSDTSDLQLGTFLPSRGYTGPFPVFCASLNISVGEDLAWQERKAASFAFTPLLSGYHIPWTGKRYSGQLSYNGFVPTERFAYPNGGIHISTVAAVSGAAISPNWGYHTSPPMAFLLTMFNVRLGWWLPNPRRSFLAFDPNAQPQAGKGFPHPRFAPIELIRELLGEVGDDSNFVYLTDGGHFDNMGLYELVRRRCYEIVICDAEEDTGPVFEGLGMAIRKCRIDFGAEIDLDLSKLATDATTGISKVHWITGTIRYPETGDAKPGTILYIKSSITGNEAADVYNYRRQHTTFPQDSTMDQWFTESQFESYRRLGQQVVDECPYLAQRP